MDIEKLAQNWKNKIENSENVYVYRENNQILGVIIFGKLEDLDGEDIGEIFVLYVKTEEKRKGIGTKLFELAKSKLTQSGYKKMVVWCLKGNKQGANFYKKRRGNKKGERDYVVGGITVREEGFIFILWNNKNKSYAVLA